MTLTITSGQIALTARPVVPRRRRAWLETWLAGPLPGYRPPDRETSRP